VLFSPHSRPSRAAARSRRLVAGLAIGVALPIVAVVPSLSAQASASSAAPLDTVIVPAVKSATLTAASSVSASSRASVVDAYENTLVPALAVSVGSVGSTSSCSAGTPSSTVQNATLTAVNFYRNLVGLPSVTFDASLSAQAQQAALMMDAQGALSHAPTAGWKCYTTPGASAAGKSDLYLGVTGPSAIAGYMVDPGSSNGEAGHRRWILYPPATKMGSGSTTRANALYVIDQGSWSMPKSVPQYVAWPPAGYLPSPLEPGGRWSLSATDSTVSFANATVSVTKNGVALPVTQNAIAPTDPNDLVGDPTLVWQLNPAFSSGSADQPYVVTVRNILSHGQSVSYQYTTTLVDPSRQTVSMTNPGTVHYGDSVSVSPSASSGQPVGLTSSTTNVCRVGSGGAVTMIAVGTCTLQVTQPGTAWLAAATPVQESFAVIPRPVAVVPSNQTAVPGAVPSSFPFTYSGLAWGETNATAASDGTLSGSPLCSSPADNSSPSGTYPITCVANSLSSGFYSFSYASASLTLALGEVPLNPYRLLDTRGTGQVRPMGQVRLPVIGRGGVPIGASAVVLNVTVTQPTTSGVITVYPSGTATPTVSNLNYVRGQTVPNSVIAPIGSDGAIMFYNRSNGTAQLVVDVSGYFVTSGSSVPGEFSPIGPARLLDTRTTTGAVRAHGRITLQVTGRAGVPANASAATLNVTVTGPKVSGFVTVYPAGAATPTASNLNFVKNQTVPNLVIAPIGANGQVVLYNNSGGTVQLVVDTVGYFVAGAPSQSGTFGALQPTRLLDTRSGVGVHAGAVGAHRSVSLQVGGRGGVPASATAVVLNVTVTQPKVAGVVTVYPNGHALPVASNLNFVKGQTVPNLVLAPVGADGRVMIYNNSGSTVQLVADVSGYFVG
jgi:uncharacterized protein YkwD